MDVRSGKVPGMRVVIAEDSAVLRDGVAQLLTERGHQVTPPP
jgi:DNA-binding response OmpR family regulator